MRLEGRKTYITAVVLGLASFALAMGWLDKTQYQVVIGLLGSLGLAALRSGVAKSTTDKTKAAGPEKAEPISGGTPVVEANVGGN
ncbi:MAG: hypothetical protein P8168_03325 [Deltaproteobacteria bacterium]|jgi:hypothetical protein